MIADRKLERFNCRSRRISAS